MNKDLRQNPDQTDIPIDLIHSEPQAPAVAPHSLPEQEVHTHHHRHSSRSARAAKRREDKILTVLMAIASFLSLGILIVLIYWLEVFFKGL